MTLLAVARDLPQDGIPATKSRSGRPPKTSKLTDDVQRQELRRNHHLSASELKEMHQDHLRTSLSDVSSTPKEGPEDTKSACCLQNSKNLQKVNDPYINPCSAEYLKGRK